MVVRCLLTVVVDQPIPHPEKEEGNCVGHNRPFGDLGRDGRCCGSRVHHGDRR